MPVRQLSMVVIATLLIVSIVGIGVAQAQLDTGESYWGERMMNGIFNLWPAAAIAILTALLAGGVFGLYELDHTSMLVLAVASAFLAYHFYWQPAHPASVQAPVHVMAVPPGARNARAYGYASAVR